MFIEILTGLISGLNFDVVSGIGTYLTGLIGSESPFLMGVSLVEYALVLQIIGLAGFGSSDTIRELYELNGGIGVGTDTEIIGDNGFFDFVVGTDGSDYIDTQNGFIDIALGQGGNDFILGGTGIDILSGGTGSDFIWGGDALDTLYGGDGNDRLFGEGGNDLIYAGAGVDYMAGGAGNDLLSGVTDDDVYDGGAGDDRLILSQAIDPLTGEPDPLADIVLMSFLEIGRVLDDPNTPENEAGLTGNFYFAGNDIIENFELGVDAILFAPNLALALELGFELDGVDLVVLQAALVGSLIASTIEEVNGDTIITLGNADLDNDGIPDAPIDTSVTLVGVTGVTSLEDVFSNLA